MSPPIWSRRRAARWMRAWMRTCPTVFPTRRSIPVRGLCVALGGGHDVVQAVVVRHDVVLDRAGHVLFQRTPLDDVTQTGRALCRERVGQFRLISVVVG